MFRSLTRSVFPVAALALALGTAPAWAQLLPGAPADATSPAPDSAEDGVETLTLPPGTSALPTTRADKRFFRLACVFNRFEVKSSEEAARATNPELKAFAARLVADRDGVCDRLQPLALAHGVKVSKSLDRQRDALFLSLQDRGTGAAFDREFSSRTLKTQREIVQLYEQAAREDTSPDVRRFAADTLPLQRRYLDDIQALDARLRGK